jgi:hypothetical protein
MIMKHVRTCQLILSLAVLSVAGTGVAYGSSVTYETSFGFTTVGFPDQSLIFPGFNVSGAVLNSVTLTFVPTGTVDNSKQTAVETSGFMQNTGGTSASHLNINFNVEYVTDDPSFNAIDFVVSAHIYGTGGSGPSSTLAAYSGSPYPGSGTPNSDTTTWTNTSTLTLLTANSGDTQTITCGACSRFLGGPVTISGVSASGNYFGTLPSSETQSATTLGSGVVDITYNYSSTPEPATMGLMGSALIGLGVFAKKFAKRRG